VTTWTNVETSMPPGALPVPVRPEELTPDWLTESLRHAGVLSPAGRVIAFDSQRVGQGAGFAGQIARVRLRYAAPEPSAPASLIAKFATEHAPTREMLGSVDGYAREVRFYRELAPEIGIGTPRCYFAHYDKRDARFCLLLEDLSPARSVDREAGLDLEQGKIVLEQLAGMHARWWNRASEIGWLVVTPDLMRRLSDRFLASLPRFNERYAGAYPELVRCAKIMGEVLVGDEALKQLRKQPLTLAHNDMHLDNILLPSAQGGRFALIDWQSVGVSRHGITDIARVLSMGMQPDVRRAHQEELLRHYHAALARAGVRGYSFRVLKKRFREELLAMVIVGVLAFDTLDFSGVGEQTAAMMAMRIEQAVRDARIASRVQPLLWLLRARRFFMRLFSSTPRISAGA
jgi:ecdysteroid kinase